MSAASGPRPVRAPRGTEISCRGWQQEAALRAVRSHIAGPGPDRWLSPDLAAAERLVAQGALVAAVESEIGALQ